MRRAALALALAVPMPALAAPDHATIAERALVQHILPGYEALAAETTALAAAAAAACADAGTIEREPLEAAYHAAFDAWIGVSHLRFGPAEENGAAFAIAFWPDTRGATPRTLAGLIANEDPIVDAPEAFREFSVAGRGLFALDQLLFDPEAPAVAAGDYICRLLIAITVDLASTSEAILARWHDPFGAILTSAGAPENPLYFAPDESTRALYSALTAGLEATHELRLGRPLGTEGRPQPRRAEAWRSARPLRNVALSIAAARDLAEAAFLPEIDAPNAGFVRGAFNTAQAAVAEVGPSLGEALAAEEGRAKVEVLQEALSALQANLELEIGDALGITAGFNAMDGD